MSRFKNCGVSSFNNEGVCRMRDKGRGRGENEIIE